MAKETYYFSHDFSARNDPKLQKVLMKLGHEGKSVFWDLVEMLFEQGGKLLLKDIGSYSFALRTTESVVNSLISDFDLFKNDGIEFWSDSALKRIEKREEKSQKYADAAKARWSKTSTEIKRDLPQFYIIHCYNESESFFKCGITTEYISRRYSGNKMPYKYDIVMQIFSNEYLKIEDEFNLILNSARYNPIINFGGYLECYDLECYDLIRSIETKHEAIEIINNFYASHNKITATLTHRNALKETKVEEIKTNENKIDSNLFGDATASQTTPKVSGNKSIETFEQRKLQFKNNLFPFTNKPPKHNGIYKPEMVLAFFEYWSEPNKSVSKMKWEIERTWDLSLRLSTWAKRDNKFNSTTKQQGNVHQTGIRPVKQGTGFFQSGNKGNSNSN